MLQGHHGAADFRGARVNACGRVCAGTWCGAAVGLGTGVSSAQTAHSGPGLSPSVFWLLPGRPARPACDPRGRAGTLAAGTLGF